MYLTPASLGKTAVDSVSLSYIWSMLIRAGRRSSYRSTYLSDNPQGDLKRQIVHPQITICNRIGVLAVRLDLYNPEVLLGLCCTSLVYVLEHSIGDLAIHFVTWILGGWNLLIHHINRSRERSAYYTVTSDETRGTVEIRIRQNAAMAAPVYK